MLTRADCSYPKEKNGAKRRLSLFGFTALCARLKFMGAKQMETAK
jgi:hypothetical protein